MIRTYPGSNLCPTLLLTLLAVCSLPLPARAAQQESRPDAATCRQYTKPTIPAAGATGQTVKLDDLIDKQDQYIGKVVTVDGEMHRIFTDRVFTIEDDDFIRDDDVLIISDVPREEAVVALEKSIEPGKNVRVTGFVHKYDRQELECLYGPLQVESREGHSFTKSPVLIVQKVQLAEAKAAPEVAAPPSEVTAAPAPEPAPAGEPVAVARAEQAQTPAPAPPAERPEVEETSAALPATAGGLPLVALLGLASMLTGVAIRVFHS